MCITCDPKGNQSWIFTGRTDVEAETQILWPPDAKSWLTGKDPDAGKDAGGEGDDRGWDGWMASPTRWTWAWVNSRSWWWTGRPGMLQSMGSQRVGYYWASKLNRSELKKSTNKCLHLAFLYICCCCSATKSCPILCDPMDCSMPGFPVLHHLPEFAQIYVHWVGDAIQPSCPLLSPSPPALWADKATTTFLALTENFFYWWFREPSPKH